MSSPLHTPRKHIVPTHLTLPDQVVTLWSFNLTARQLLLALVGGGIGGNLWHDLALLGPHGVPGEIARGLLALLPFLLALVIGYYQHAGRFLEVWAIVLLRYALQPKRYIWRTIRTAEQHLYPLVPTDIVAYTQETTPVTITRKGVS